MGEELGPEVWKAHSWFPTEPAPTILQSRLAQPPSWAGPLGSASGSPLRPPVLLGPLGRPSLQLPLPSAS